MEAEGPPSTVVPLERCLLAEEQAHNHRSILYSFMAVAPIEFGNDLLRRAEALARAARSPQQADSPQRDMLRSAWVMVGAAIDTYFHERVRRALLAKPMSGSASKYALELGPVEDLIDGFLRDRSSSRPRVVLMNILHDRLLTDTFQGSSNVERAFALIGARQPWVTLSNSMGDTTVNIKRRLDSQYARRNRIAHQGDYSRQERPRVIFYDLLERSEVDAEIVWTTEFLRAADNVT